MLCFEARRSTILLAIALGPALAVTAAAQEFRKLAPGVETTIAAEIKPEETTGTHEVVELRAQADLKWSPNYAPETDTLYEIASDTEFRRTVTALEFTFKPLRMIYVDLPQPSGKMQRKLVWYMVYRVTNRGGHLAPEQKPDGTWTTKKVDRPVRFIPHFVLETQAVDPARTKAYLDRVIPAAIGPIQMRETPHRALLNTVEMAKRPIPLSTDRIDRSVWGVVTWVDIDPRINFFSIYVQGLSSAYRWIDPPGAYQAGDAPGKGRRFVRKTLQLNFWRPGDEHKIDKDQIYYGTPPASVFNHTKAANARNVRKLYGVLPGVDYVWVYR